MRAWSEYIVAAPTVASPSPTYRAFSPTTPSSASFQPQYAGANVSRIHTSDSSVSLQSQFDAHGQPLKGRESMVSMQSYYDSPTSPQQPDPYVGASHTAYTPPTSWIGGHQSQGYEPVPTATPLSLSRSGSSRTRRGCYSLAFSGEHEATLPTAAPMGQDQSYEAVPAHDAADDVPFDPTSTLGPPSLQDDSFVKKLQEAEAKGHLTGGLGAGWKPEERFLGSELARALLSLQRSITRRSSHLLNLIEMI
ncbi:hypothetical protein SAPIO_CDS3812 [Scedosporium apiospermum]|uniref:Uncharacterized protein n=1 Tax=Pseudallescheria apiosperma TaxID=563466 RepID=A0A084G9Q6_PSEDA|nr:uncharacterized protein SAPIO_CDS3812 [Scedosporium apiospermum]KEZ44068.1 hypothetical protein SAPIO_CDS3812 [Scedosporium apiospermum]